MTIKTSFRISSHRNRIRAVMFSASSEHLREPIYIWKEWIRGYLHTHTARGSCDVSDIPSDIMANIAYAGPNKWVEWPLKVGEGIRYSNRRAQ